MSGQQNIKEKPFKLELLEKKMKIPLKNHITKQELPKLMQKPDYTLPYQYKTINHPQRINPKINTKETKNIQPQRDMRDLLFKIAKAKEESEQHPSEEKQKLKEKAKLQRMTQLKTNNIDIDELYKEFDIQTEKPISNEQTLKQLQIKQLISQVDTSLPLKNMWDQSRKLIKNQANKGLISNTKFKRALFLEGKKLRKKMGKQGKSDKFCT